MKTSSGHILTSHAGSLPRPDDQIAAWGANDERLTASVAEVVRRHKEIGCVSDSEISDGPLPTPSGPKSAAGVAPRWQS
jgi:hypothetical protein